MKCGIKAHLRSFYLYKSLCVSACICVCVCVCVWERLCVLAPQVRFSSFPPHLPPAHSPPLSQSVSSETTYVSSGSPKRRARWWTEVRPAQVHTCARSDAHTEFRRARVVLAGWAPFSSWRRSPAGRRNRGDKDGWIMIKEVVKA